MLNPHTPFGGFNSLHTDMSPFINMEINVILRVRVASMASAGGLWFTQVDVARLDHFMEIVDHC